MTTIPSNMPNMPEPPQRGKDKPEVFRSKADSAWSWLLNFHIFLFSFVVAINAFGKEAYTIWVDIRRMRDEAQAAANIAKGVVIPTEATYSKEEIDESISTIGNIALTTRMRQNKIKIEGWIE